MSAFTEEQLSSLERMFQVLGDDLEQQASSHYTNNDAAREAILNVALAVRNFQPQFVQP